MAKWKCEICGNEFENFHAQGFDNKIYCPLCYFKKENQELKKQLENCFCNRTDCAGRIKGSKTYYSLEQKLKNQQKEFINFLEDNWEKTQDIWYIKILQKYKSIIGVSDDKTN